LRLDELLREEGTIRRNLVNGDTEVTITGLTSDSRRVRPGYLFAALPGVRADGRDFVLDAVGRGAAAVLVAAAPDVDRVLRDAAGRAVPVIVDENPRRRFARLAARFFGRQPRVIAAVTGTNGKTSVAWFLRQIWSRLGHPAAALGTLGLIAPDGIRPGGLTTPDPVALHETLARLAAEGVDYLAMEASSHGLDQHRLDGVRVQAGGFTNLTRDHLDYHGSVAAYLAAKLRLFETLIVDGGTAVINADVTHADAVRAAAGRRLRLLSYGRAGADLRLDGVDRRGVDGQRLRLTVAGCRHDVALPLVGDFQAMNAVCAVGLAWACGAAPATAIAALERLEPVPGRLERVAGPPGGVAVFVDYAHTPDALAAALIALRPFADGRLTVVFGCGGDRDRGKRPQMGQVAAELADQAIVTDDNARGEEPAEIRRQILGACPGAIEIGERAEAIRVAIRTARPGDIVLIAGKGHETGQIVGDAVLPFDDRLIARAAVLEAEA
jgi:UDP-N-acetylmuramoyl-L-alanyl-D-glutamate--2,6-diaminopimelate ligase